MTAEHQVNHFSHSGMDLWSAVLVSQSVCLSVCLLAGQWIVDGLPLNYVIFMVYSWYNGIV